MKNAILASAIFIVSTVSCQEQTLSDSIYSYKSGDPYGTGKWYMGREIAYVMGHTGIDWLERDEREEEEKTNKLIRNLDLQSSDIIADIGAGSGYHVFKIAPELKTGKVFAVDIQEEMLEVIREKKDQTGLENILAVRGSEKSVNLRENSIDKVLMVDVYHEFAFPREMMASMSKCLKDDGRIFLVEYRKEDEWVPIKEVHKMTEEQAVKEMKAAGFELERNIGNLPWQHCMVFRKK
jgi:SAM-dependent methyltransferase